MWGVPIGVLRIFLRFAADVKCFCNLRKIDLRQIGVKLENQEKTSYLLALKLHRLIMLVPLGTVLRDLSGNEGE